MTLDELGWRQYVSKQAAPHLEGGFAVGRVAVQHKNGYVVYLEQGEAEGIVRGKLLKTLPSAELPKVGDWVLVTKLPGEDKVVVESVLPRFAKISRKANAEAEEQVMVANVDTVFIVQGLGGEFNVRKLERYITTVQQGGAQPVAVLNKTDLDEGYYEAVAEARAIAGSVPVVAVSAKTGQGMEQLKTYIRPGETVVFLGSSGVGKSSLVNALVGIDLQKTGEVRLTDSKGRHTTTRRETVLLPGGGILVDTPGMRELGLWSDSAEVVGLFDDIEELAGQCRYRDCDHERTEECAVLAAVQDGSLDRGRYASFLKLKKEAEFAASKSDKYKQLERKGREKRLSRVITKVLKHKYPRR